jgi:hypothetical protein
VHFKESKKPFSKWFHGASIHNIYAASNPGAEGVPYTQEKVGETWYKALVDKWKQAKQEENNEQAASIAAEEDEAEDLTEEDKTEESTVEDVKAASAHVGKHAKKNSYTMEPSTSKKPAKKKNSKRSWGEMIC